MHVLLTNCGPVDLLIHNTSKMGGTNAEVCHQIARLYVDLPTDLQTLLLPHKLASLTRPTRYVIRLPPEVEAANRSSCPLSSSPSGVSVHEVLHCQMGEGLPHVLEAACQSRYPHLFLVKWCSCISSATSVDRHAPNAAPTNNDVAHPHKSLATGQGPIDALGGHLALVFAIAALRAMEIGQEE